MSNVTNEIIPYPLKNCLGYRSNACNKLSLAAKIEQQWRFTVWEKATYDEFLAVLNENSPIKIAAWLSRILEEPCGNSSILPHLEKLTEDRRITNLSSPSKYGELRWNAAAALVTERYMQNSNEAVFILENSFEPLDMPNILMLIADSSFTIPSGSEWPSRIGVMRDAGNLPLANYEFRFGQEPRKV
jgi:hypothetical protein